MTSSHTQTDTWLDQPVLQNLPLRRETLIFAVILILAVVTRFYDLGARVMSHDENSHVYYSWQLSRGGGYVHTPLTHGPFQFHIVALSYFLFGDSDFTARIPAALFGIAVIAFMWAWRRYLGRTGALVAATLLLISPFMLYYSRYVRNDIFSALAGVVMLWAVLRYLESGEARYTYWMTAAAVLHYTAKETAFIYSAQILLFLGLLFVHRLSRREWPRPEMRAPFFYALMLAVIFPMLGIGAQRFLAPAAENPGKPVWLISGFGLAALALLGALWAALTGFSWQRLKSERAFGLMLLHFTLILPQLAPFPVKALGWDPLDYSPAGMLRTGVFLVILAAGSVAAGVAWDANLWLTNAAIFYIPFTILYTTVFTNGSGFFTGMVGSLGYWLAQQGVQRGSQPWYYYILVQVPMYEFLPLLGSLIAGGMALVGGRRSSFREDQPDVSPVVPLLSFWVVTSILAYTLAGEKMPWLTVHIAYPLILLASWGLGRLIENVDWAAVRSRRGVLVLLLILLFLLSFSTALGILLSNNPPFQGKEIDQLARTNAFLLAVVMSAIALVGLFRWIEDWDLLELGRLTLLTFFAFLAVLTARAAFRAAYVNYDYATEYLVYAHSGPGPKIALQQIEELSRRTTGGLDMVVAYDDETTYPFWWYLRNFPNQRYFGANPTRDLRDAPVILVGDNNFQKIEPVVGNAYDKFEYVRIWWPNQDYFNLTWERVKNALFNREMRSAIFQIWLNRDYTQYAALTGKQAEFNPSTWVPADRMRLYVRKDIAAQVWNYGEVPVVPEPVQADPYEGKGITLMAEAIFGENGTQPGEFERPRDVAVAPDGSIYVADTGNHRIQHIGIQGEVLHVWGTFADSSQGPAHPGTFYEPWGVAVGPDGSVYVADTWNHRVQKFTAEGEFITQWGYFGQGETATAFWGPRDVVVDGSGRVYITDTGNKRVVVFDADGNFITSFGSAGLLAGQFDEPVGLAVDAQGRVYVADTWNQRVQVFEPDESGLHYAPVLEWPIVGWYGQSLDNKPYLAVDEAGHVYVSDPEGYRILEFSTEGEFIRYWGDFGDGPDGLNLPAGLAVDAQGRLWVADAGNHRILRFSPPE
ncbi:MAG: TIGR03663 family protein [Anaerolineae bacterium]|nr:MAG: TIGR03663 family protein [Anaerolineae bacterium]